MKQQIFAIVVFSLALNMFGCNPITDSHIQANVPDSKDFNAFLQRDLNKYFQTGRSGVVQVDFELLRKGPTQTGIAFPKYYAWVLIREGGKESKQGAVRLAAMNKSQFEVTNIVDADAIRRDPHVIESIFPQALCDSIRKRSGISEALKL